jgi:hypothetical protein
MMNLKRIGSTAAIALVAAGSGLVASPASASPCVSRADDPERIVTANRVQTTDNRAGVIFHRLGDKFEIWDNVKDGKGVDVCWNYVGINDKWKSVHSRVHHTLIRRNMKEFPHQIYFYITDSRSMSLVVKYPTYGS